MRTTTTRNEDEFAVPLGLDNGGGGGGDMGREDFSGRRNKILESGRKSPVIELYNPAATTPMTTTTQVRTPERTTTTPPLRLSTISPASTREATILIKKKKQQQQKKHAEVEEESILSSDFEDGFDSIREESDNEEDVNGDEAPSTSKTNQPPSTVTSASSSVSSSSSSAVINITATTYPNKADAEGGDDNDHTPRGRRMTRRSLSRDRGRGGRSWSRDRVRNPTTTTTIPRSRSRSRSKSRDRRAAPPPPPPLRRISHPPPRNKSVGRGGVRSRSRSRSPLPRQRKRSLSRDRPQPPLLSSSFSSSSSVPSRSEYVPASRRRSVSPKRRVGGGGSEFDDPRRSYTSNIATKHNFRVTQKEYRHEVGGGGNNDSKAGARDTTTADTSTASVIGFPFDGFETLQSSMPTLMSAKMATDCFSATAANETSRDDTQAMLRREMISIIIDGVTYETRHGCVVVRSTIHRKLLKIMRQPDLTRFAGEAAIMHIIESKRHHFPCVIPYYGSMVMAVDDLLYEVGLINHLAARDLGKHLSPSIDKSVHENHGADDLGNWGNGDGGAADDHNQKTKTGQKNHVGIMIMEYMETGETLNNYLAKKRHDSEPVYEGELHFIIASVTSTLAEFQRLFPGFKHHDMLLANILVEIKLDLGDVNRTAGTTHWNLHTMPNGRGGWFTIPRPPGMRVALIDYGLSSWTYGPSVHLDDAMLAVHGITPEPNDTYDLHTFLNILSQFYVDTFDYNKLLMPEKKLCDHVLKLYGHNHVGVGVTVSTNFRQMGHNTAPTSLSVVERRLSDFPRLLRYNPGDVKEHIQLAAVNACKRGDPHLLKVYTLTKHHNEVMNFLNPERISEVRSLTNYICPIHGTTPITFLLDNPLGLSKLRSIRLSVPPSSSEHRAQQGGASVDTNCFSHRPNMHPVGVHGIYHVPSSSNFWGHFSTSQTTSISRGAVFTSLLKGRAKSSSTSSTRN